MSLDVNPQPILMTIIVIAAIIEEKVKPPYNNLKIPIISHESKLVQTKHLFSGIIERTL